MYEKSVNAAEKYSVTDETEEIKISSTSHGCIKRELINNIRLEIWIKVANQDDTHRIRLSRFGTCVFSSNYVSAFAVVHDFLLIKYY